MVQTQLPANGKDHDRSTVNTAATINIFISFLKNVYYKYKEGKKFI